MKVISNLRIFFHFPPALLLLSAFTIARGNMDPLQAIPPECKDLAPELTCKQWKSSESCGNPILEPDFYCNKTCKYCI
ncbi:hypothetical protein Y032_0015g2871 [Ancylostoma ceylanicum]|uniref:ShKT domain-containing protein n=1 Tax=Ancylostoma ceylanicum TaxID=53326 RepID=A0A016V991_9BILA|nr:hypothetical protein Y032_0015g2871 [Ancylostoma ceylanicum]